MPKEHVHFMMVTKLSNKVCKHLRALNLLLSDFFYHTVGMRMRAMLMRTMVAVPRLTIAVCEF